MSQLEGTFSFNSQDSTSPSQCVQNTTSNVKEGVRRVTLKQLRTAAESIQPTHSLPTFSIDGHPLEKFALVANIRDMSGKRDPPETQFEFDDGYGRIHGFKSGIVTGFRGLNDSFLPNFSGFNYVFLIGQLKWRNGAVVVQIMFIRAIEDAHEIYYHTLQVIFDAVRYERGNPTRRDWEMSRIQATEDSGSSVYEDAEESEDNHGEAGPSTGHGKLRVIDVELSSDEEHHEGFDTESSDDSFNNIAVTVTNRHRASRSQPRVSTSTRDSSRSVSPPRSIISDNDRNGRHHADLDGDSSSEFSELEPIGGQFDPPERLTDDFSPTSPARTVSSSIPSSPPNHYAYSDHERDLDAPTEDELEEAFQRHLEEEIVSSIHELRQATKPSRANFRGVQVFEVIGAIKSAFPELPAETYCEAIERLIDNGALTSRTDDPYYVDVVQP